MFFAISKNISNRHDSLRCLCKELKCDIIDSKLTATSVTRYASVRIAAKQNSEALQLSSGGAAVAAATAHTAGGSGGGTAAAAAALPVAIARMDTWTPAKVAEWLKQNELQHITDRCRNSVSGAVVIRT